MLMREQRHRPASWAEHGQSLGKRWTRPFHRVDWFFQWLAYYLARWAFLEVLDYLGVLSVLFGVIFYWSEASDRMKQKHYQAWQVINTAQGKGGSGGRIEALRELNADHEPLVGVDVSSAFLQGIRLPHAAAERADFESVDARDGVFTQADLAYADFKMANFRHSDFSHAKLQSADFEGADLVGATFEAADLTDTNLKNADLRHCDLRGVQWKSIRAIDSANVFDVRNAPPGFVEWARQHGAISDPGPAE